MTISCGIDFGTSNSALAVAKGGSVELAVLEGQSNTLPSAIFYPFEGKPLFGRQAMQAFIDGEEGRFMRSLKRLLGTSLMGQGTIVNGRNKKFEGILADFIGHMKGNAESQFGGTMENVVMGRPVHFVDGDAAADARAQSELERIAKSVGFKAVEFQYEPIAAAFAHERQLTGEKLALVVDIGGGTSDFTVIRLSGNSMDKIDRKDDILANSGVRIGGNDFDKDLCLAVFMPPLGYRTTYGDKQMTLPVSPFFDMSEWSKINFLYTPKVRSQIADLYYQSHDKEKFGRFVKVLKEETGHQLLSVVEDSKISLTDRMDTEAALDFIQDGLKVQVARSAFNMAVDKHVAGISRSVTDCLQQASIGEEKIELVILTGGTTEVPVLRDMVRKRFPQATFSEENKLSSVGLGLGYDSVRRFGGPVVPALTPKKSSGLDFK
jgi:hypothetical chaperone protein